VAETFFGTWSLLIQSKDAAFAERVTISGSENSDGSIDGIAGQFIPEILGDEWTAEMEWSGDGGATWHPSAIRRTMAVTDADGIVITLGADDNEPAARDGDFNDLVAVFTYLDPSVNPVGPPGGGFDFSIPEEWVRQGPDQPNNPDVPG
jgi:hypothetical protein